MLVTGHHVVGGVAGSTGRKDTGEDEVLEVGAKRVHDACGDSVDPALRRLHHHVAQVVDEIDVIARAAVHRVDTGATVQRVIAATRDQCVVARKPVQGVACAIADQDVAARVASGIDVGRSDQREVLDVAAKGEAGRGDHAVDAAGRVVDRFLNHVRTGIDKVDVVAIAGVHAVAARAAVERVHAAVAIERVAAAACSGFPAMSPKIEVVAGPRLHARSARESRDTAAHRTIAPGRRPFPRLAS